MLLVVGHDKKKKKNGNFLGDGAEEGGGGERQFRFTSTPRHFKTELLLPRITYFRSDLNSVFRD